MKIAVGEVVELVELIEAQDERLDRKSVV